jgi:hypothetical protein
MAVMTSAPDAATPERHPGPLVRGRECGECQICCIVPIIDKPEIQKRSGSPCRHSLHGGCDIYESRPEVCSSFFCGWRRSRDFPDDWRPDRSGIFAVLEVNKLPQFKPLAIAVHLVGNPLKTVRQPDFIDFVIKNVRSNVALYLMLPGAPGTHSARLALNNPLVADAAGKSRAEVKAVLEMMLKRLAAHPVPPYVMENSGNDLGT